MDQALKAVRRFAARFATAKARTANPTVGIHSGIHQIPCISVAFIARHETVTYYFVARKNRS